MFVPWISSLGLLTADEESNIIGNFSLEVRLALISQVVTYVHDESSNSHTLLHTSAHVKWTMECIGQSFALPISTAVNEILSKAIVIYRRWLFEGPKPEPIPRDQRFYQRIFEHMSLLFCRKERGSASRENCETHLHLCREVLRIYAEVSRRLSPVLDDQTTEVLLRVVFGICDGTLTSSDGFPSLRSLALKTLFEVWLRSRTRSNALWEALQRRYAEAWVFERLAVLHWTSVSLALTLRVIRLLYGCTEGLGFTLIEWHDSQSPKHTLLRLCETPKRRHGEREREYHVLGMDEVPDGAEGDVYKEGEGESRVCLGTVSDVYYLWQQTLHVLGNPNFTTPSHSLSPSLPPQNFLDAITGVAKMTDAFVHIGLKPPKVRRGDKPPPSPSPPNGNTVLRVFGHWLFEAVQCTDKKLATGRAVAFGALCRIFCSRYGGEPFLPLSLSRFYSALSLSLSPPRSLSLSLSLSPDPLTISAILRNTTLLFTCELEGVRILVSVYMETIRKVLLGRGERERERERERSKEKEKGGDREEAEKEREKDRERESPDASTQSPNPPLSLSLSLSESDHATLRKACINILFSWICFPGHFGKLLPDGMDDYLSTLLTSALSVERERENLELLLSCVAVYGYENAERHPEKVSAFLRQIANTALDSHWRQSVGGTLWPGEVILSAIEMLRCLMCRRERERESEGEGEGERERESEDPETGSLSLSAESTTIVSHLCRFILELLSPAFQQGTSPFAYLGNNFTLLNQLILDAFHGVIDIVLQYSEECYSDSVTLRLILSTIERALGARDFGERERERESEKEKERRESGGSVSGGGGESSGSKRFSQSLFRRLASSGDSDHDSHSDSDADPHSLSLSAGGVSSSLNHNLISKLNHSPSSSPHLHSHSHINSPLGSSHSPLSASCNNSNALSGSSGTGAGTGSNGTTGPGNNKRGGKGVKSTKVARKGVEIRGHIQHMAEYALLVLFNRVGHFPAGRGATRISTPITEPDTAFTGSNPHLIRTFLLGTCTLLSVWEVPEKEECIVVVRDKTGKYAWRFRMRYGEREREREREGERESEASGVDGESEKAERERELKRLEEIREHLRTPVEGPADTDFTKDDRLRTKLLEINTRSDTLTRIDTILSPQTVEQRGYFGNAIELLQRVKDVEDAVDAGVKFEGERERERGTLPPSLPPSLHHRYTGNSHFQVGRLLLAQFGLIRPYGNDAIISKGEWRSEKEREEEGGDIEWRERERDGETIPTSLSLPLSLSSQSRCSTPRSGFANSPSLSHSLSLSTTVSAASTHAGEREKDRDKEKEREREREKERERDSDDKSGTASFFNSLFHSSSNSNNEESDNSEKGNTALPTLPLSPPHSTSPNYHPLTVLEHSPRLQRAIKLLDHTWERDCHKIGVIYVRKGQNDEAEILQNEERDCSGKYTEFLESLGWRVEIGEHDGYPGGLGSDTSAIYHATPQDEIIFHVPTLLPTKESEVQQIHKKKHVGNDHVHIVWTEHPREYRRETIQSQFNFVHVVVHPLPGTAEGLYRVRVYRKDTSRFSTPGNPRPIWPFGPLQDGSIVSKRILGDLVRWTAVSANRRVRLLTGFQPTFEIRKRMIEDIRGRYARDLKPEELYRMMLGNELPQ